MPHNFWMIILNAENYGITRDLGFTIQGLKDQHRRKVQRVGNGDRILYFVSKSRRFTATATATSSYFEDGTPIWQNEGSAGWPYRVHIKPEVILDESQFIDANLLAPRLDYVKRWPPENWYMAFQGNLHLLPKGDFLLIEEEMKKLKLGRDYSPGALSPLAAAPKRKRVGHRRNRPAPAAAAPAPGGGGSTESQ